MGKKLKTSITLDEDYLKWIEKEIAKKRFASVSHAVEYALEQVKQKS